MKKRIFIIVLALFLCGCHTEQIYEKPEFVEAATFPTEIVEAFPLLDMGEASSVTCGSVGEYVTPLGRFYVTVDGEESFDNRSSDPKPFILTFDDYQTGETYPVCADPQCQHNAPSCSAFFSLSSGQPECFYCDGAYLYFYLCGEEALYRQRLDGTERKKLFQLSGYHVDLLYEGKTAYCLGTDMEKDDETGKPITQRSLSTLNLETGEQRELPFSFAGSFSEVSLLDKYGNELIMRCDYSLDPLQPFQDISKTRYMIFLLNMENGDITMLLDDISTYAAAASCPGYLICTTFDEGSETSLQFQDGKQPVFSGDIFIFDLQNRVRYALPDQPCLTWDYSIYDGKLFYCDMSSDKTALEPKIRDLKTGKVFPWNFRISEEEHSIIAESGDFFIVRSSGNDYRILKEDYYLGNVQE